MNSFSIAKKGYAKEEVEEYIKRNTVYNENKMKEQKERIEELKQTVDKMNREMLRLLDREDNVKNALISANEKSNELVNTSKLRYAIEGQRLKLFKERWTNYYNGAVARNKEDIVVQLHKFDRELYEIMEAEFGIQSSYGDDVTTQYMSEAKRLFGGGDNVYTDIVKSVASKKDKFTEIGAKDSEPFGNVMATVSFSHAERNRSIPQGETSERFDLEEALRPKQSLEELCRELGTFIA